MQKGRGVHGNRQPWHGQAMAEVIEMASKKYRDLSALLAEDKQARAIFEEIPQYAREQIAERGGSINSVESLSDYIDNILRGDD